MHRFALAFFALGASGCALLFPAATPMRAWVDRHASGAGPARCLVVLFPGAGDRAERFGTEAFSRILRKSGASADLVAVDATLGYYFRGTMVERVQQDILQRERARGYTHVWYMGMSMGGFGAVFYAMQDGQPVDGILALSPYLGGKNPAHDIELAGGLVTWTPPERQTVTEDNYRGQLWGYLQRLARSEPGLPTLYLGYSPDESLARQDRVLAAALPASRVYLEPGPHDWPTWTRILERFLKESDFLARCAPPSAQVLPTLLDAHGR